jgi:hypothetical protein
MMRRHGPLTESNRPGKLSDGALLVRIARLVRLVRSISGALPIDFRLRQTLFALFALFAHFFAL